MTDVILTIGRLSIGGAEARLLHLAKELQRTGAPFQLTFFVVSGMTGELDAAVREAGAEIVYGLPGMRGLPALWRLCRKKRPAALHVNAGTAAGFYGLAGLLAGTRIRIAHLRNMAGPTRASRLPRKLGYEIAMNLFCNRIVGVSDGSRMGRLVWRRWRRIFNGIPVPSADDYPGVATQPTGPHRIVMLARLGREKNIPRAMRIFAVLKGRGFDAQLHLCGPEGTEPVSGIISLADQLGLADKVILSGPVSDAYSELEQASLLLMTSPAEGLPGSVLEALACGVPVVASDLPSLREITSHVPGVSLVSLDAPDTHWADAIEAAVSADRAAIRESFNLGPFRSAAYVAAITQLWEGR